MSTPVRRFTSPFLLDKKFVFLSLIDVCQYVKKVFPLCDTVFNENMSLFLRTHVVH